MITTRLLAKIMLDAILFTIRKNFWKQVKQLRKSSQTPVHHQIDGIVDDMTTSEVFRNKLSLTLNKYASHPFNPTSLTQDLDSSIYHTFSSETVSEAIQLNILREIKRIPIWSPITS